MNLNFFFKQKKQKKNIPANAIANLQKRKNIKMC